MATPASNSAALKSLLALHKGMLLAQLVFAMIGFYLVYARSFSAVLHYPDQILQVAAIVFSVAGFYTGKILFKRKLLRAKEMQADASVKLAVYRNACILQWVLMEGPALFVILCFLLTGNYAFLALAILLMLFFAILAPSRIKILFHLQLSEGDLGEL